MPNTSSSLARPALLKSFRTLIEAHPELNTYLPRSQTIADPEQREGVIGYLVDIFESVWEEQYRKVCSPSVLARFRAYVDSCLSPPAPRLVGIELNPGPRNPLAGAVATMVTDLVTRKLREAKPAKRAKRRPRRRGTLNAESNLGQTRTVNPPVSMGYISTRARRAPTTSVVPFRFYGNPIVQGNNGTASSAYDVTMTYKNVRGTPWAIQFTKSGQTDNNAVLGIGNTGVSTIFFARSPLGG